MTFTGSVPTGGRVNVVAARTFKRVALELGGKSPNIVFDDANLDDAVKGAIGGIFAASGQTCVAGSRLLLQGDPRDPTTQIGPIATKPQYERVVDDVRIAKLSIRGMSWLNGMNESFNGGTSA